jgi:hypothetical protein
MNNSINDQSSERHILHSIAEKTKRQKVRHIIMTSFSIFFEILCYLLFFALMTSIIFLPTYLGAKLEIAEEEIGFYILDPNEKEGWTFILRAVILFFSLFPLMIALLLHRLRSKNKLIHHVYMMSKEFQ